MLDLKIGTRSSRNNNKKLTVIYKFNLKIDSYVRDSSLNMCVVLKAIKYELMPFFLSFNYFLYLLCR